MLTQITTNENTTCYAIILDNYAGYENIRNLQNALLWAIRTISIDTDNCGAIREIWPLADLLAHLIPTEEQTHDMDRLLDTQRLVLAPPKRADKKSIL